MPKVFDESCRNSTLSKQMLDARGSKIRPRQACYDIKQTADYHSYTPVQNAGAPTLSSQPWQTGLLVTSTCLYLLRLFFFTNIYHNTVDGAFHLQLPVNHVYAAIHVCEVMCPTSKCPQTRLAAGVTTSLQPNCSHRNLTIHKYLPSSSRPITK